MGALCTIADVEALVGAPVPDDRKAGVDRLIELASGIVTDACRLLPVETPETVTTVTATLVTRQYLNPSMASSEALTGYRVGYAATGLVLTDADREALGGWAAVQSGRGARSIVTPAPYAVDDEPYDGWPFVIIDEPVAAATGPAGSSTWVERLDQ
jgi:hypothetical protein